MDLYASKCLTPTSDMVVLELADPIWVHKDEDPTPLLAPNRKRKRESRMAGVIEITRFGAMKSWMTGSIPVGRPS